MLFHNITLNADAMVNFLNTDSFTLGAYVGFGLGYGITGLTGEKMIVDTLNKEQDYNRFNIPINVGIAATFGGSHKVEIGAKIQALSAEYSSKTKNDKSETLMNTHVINVGYSYIF
ncbi:outer membrane beta-barrel protein [Helicobacter bilis]|uniref:outer membrane beta-barrel protein n=1 Tax=Helicobacter bilis TaxID=37372 RepID=UPI00248F43F8|nr:outer membrane beta-barrel protein [Helicobacter bilis]